MILISFVIGAANLSGTPTIHVFRAHSSQVGIQIHFPEVGNDRRAEAP